MGASERTGLLRATDSQRCKICRVEVRKTTIRRRDSSNEDVYCTNQLSYKLYSSGLGSCLSIYTRALERALRTYELSGVSTSVHMRVTSEVGPRRYVNTSICDEYGFKRDYSCIYLPVTKCQYNPSNSTVVWNKELHSLHL